jgi:hypothetical protein
MAEAAGKRGAESKDQADVEPGIPYSQRLQHPSRQSCYKGCQPRGGQTHGPGNFSIDFEAAFAILADPEDVADYPQLSRDEKLAILRH